MQTRTEFRLFLQEINNQLFTCKVSIETYSDDDRRNGEIVNDRIEVNQDLHFFLISYDLQKKMSLNSHVDLLMSVYYPDYEIKEQK